MSVPLDRRTTDLADRHRRDRELGEGGIATAYLAHDLKHVTLIDSREKDAGVDPAGGRLTRLGSVPAGGLWSHSFARDGRRAVRSERRPRGDVWALRDFDGRAVPEAGAAGGR